MSKEQTEAVDYMLEKFNNMHVLYDPNTLMKISEDKLNKMISLHSEWRKAIFANANLKVGPGGNKKAKQKRQKIKKKVTETKTELDNFVLELSDIIK